MAKERKITWQFVAMPTQIVEFLYSNNNRLRQYDRAVLDVILRHSYGFHDNKTKQPHEAKINQEFIAGATGIKPPNINRSIKSLEAKGLIKVLNKRRIAIVKDNFISGDKYLSSAKLSPQINKVIPGDKKNLSSEISNIDTRKEKKEGEGDQEGLPLHKILSKEDVKY